MKPAEMIGKTLRAVLESLHEKPAEQITVDNEPLEWYAHNLDETITEVWESTENNRDARSHALVTRNLVWLDAPTQIHLHDADEWEPDERGWRLVAHTGGMVEMDATRGANTMHIKIIEIGLDPQTDQPIDHYHIIAAAFDGERAQELEHAQRIVTERGYCIMPPSHGGCCERVDDLIEITVYAPDGVTAPRLVDERAVNYFRSLAAQGRATGNYAGLGEIRHVINGDTYRVHIDTHNWTMTVYRHSAGADGRPTDPGVEIETVTL